MKWTRGHKSENVEDRRHVRAGGRGRGRGLKLGAGGTVVALVVLLVFGKDYLGLLSGGTQPAAPGANGRSGAPLDSKEEQEKKEFVSFVLDDIQGTWQRKLRGYRPAKLVLFRDAVQSGCGNTSSAVGPFYCGADEKAYIDMSFYDDLKKRFGAPGDFAQAYVLAHEIGHHVQSITGKSSEFRALKRRSPSKKNQVSVMQELQADCYAGIWAHDTNKRELMQEGDIEEGMNAAAAIGDDRLQKSAGKRVNPHSWTHGSSKQRVEWFMRGFRTGRVADCEAR